MIPLSTKWIEKINVEVPKSNPWVNKIDFQIWYLFEIGIKITIDRKRARDAARAMQRKRPKVRKTMYSLLKDLNIKIQHCIAAGKSQLRKTDIAPFEKPVVKSGEAWTSKYLEKIKQPICIQDMIAKHKKREYKKFDEFIADIDLLINNTKYFWMEVCKVEGGSEYANVIQKFKEKVQTAAKRMDVGNTIVMKIEIWWLWRRQILILSAN